MTRLRDPEPVDRGPHHQLVLGVDQRLRPGAYGDPVGGEAAQVVGGDVLVVEGDHAAAVDDPAQGGQVGVVTHDVVGDDLVGRHARRLGQEPQGDAHRRGRFGHHPGQLAATDDSDRGRSLGPGAHAGQRKG